MTRRQFPDLSRFVQQLASLGLNDVGRALQSLVGLPGQAPIGEPAASATYTPLTPAMVQNRVAEALNPAWGPQVIGPTDRGVSVFRRTVAGSRWEEVKGEGLLACTPASAIKLFETNDETLIRTFNPLYDSGYDVQRFSASAKVAALSSLVAMPYLVSSPALARHPSARVLIIRHPRSPCCAGLLWQGKAMRFPHSSCSAKLLVHAGIMAGMHLQRVRISRRSERASASRIAPDLEGGCGRRAALRGFWTR
mgnify:CR=1 FL=1